MFEFLEAISPGGGGLGALGAPSCNRQQRQLSRLIKSIERQARVHQNAQQKLSACVARGRRCRRTERALQNAARKLNQLQIQKQQLEQAVRSCSSGVPSGAPGVRPAPGYLPPRVTGQPWAPVAPVSKQCRGRKIAHVMPNGRIKCVTPKAKLRLDCKAQGGRIRGGVCQTTQVAGPGVTPTTPPAIFGGKTCKGNKIPHVLPNGRTRCVTPKRKTRLDCVAQGGRWRNGQCVAPGGSPSSPISPTTKQCKGNKIPYTLPNGRVRCVTDRRAERLDCVGEGGKWKRGDCVFPSDDFGPETFYQPPTLWMPPEPPAIPTPGEPVDQDALNDFNFACSELGGAFSVQGNPPGGVCSYQGQNYTDIDMLPEPGGDQFFEDASEEEICDWYGGFFYDGQCNSVPQQGTPSGMTPAQECVQRGGIWNTLFARCDSPSGPGQPLPDTGPGLITPIEGETDPFAGGFPAEGGGAVTFDAPLVEEIPEGFEDEGAPLFSAPVQTGLRECDPNFSAALPLEYSDKYGPMQVLQVVCAQTAAVGGQGGGVMDAGSIGPVETMELQDLTQGDLF